MANEEKSKVRSIKVSDGVISVSRTVVHDGSEEVAVTRKKIEIRPFVTEVAHVGVKMGATFTLSKKFHTARVDVMINVPCYVEEIVDTYSATKKLAEELVEKEIEDVRKKDLGVLADGNGSDDLLDHIDELV